jgi:hypothetical protein
LSKSAGPVGRSWEPEVELRSGLAVVGIVALALASCATIFRMKVVNGLRRMTCGFDDVPADYRLEFFPSR